MNQNELNLHDFETIIFDMDGVLIDSEPLWKIAMGDVFRSTGSNLTKEDFQKTVGLRLDEVIAYWHYHEDWKNVSVEELEIQVVDRMKELIHENGIPLPGVLETLAFLKEKGFKIGLATSSYRVLIETVLYELGIADFFDVTHSAESETYGKPHPAVYLFVADALKTDPMKCLVIEDSLNGIISAKAAKMKVVCIPEKTHHPDPRLILADFQLESMQELVDLFKRENILRD